MATAVGRYCPHCGKRNEKAGNFCRYCGSKYGKDAIEAADFKKTTVDRRISKAVQWAVWCRDEGRCVGCGTREGLKYDHIIPVSKGGSNTARNVQLLCEQCNRKKHDKIGA